MKSHLSMTSSGGERFNHKMADSEEYEWFVGEDGCLSVGRPASSVTYHSTLNTILVTTKDPYSVEVLDVTSGSILQSSDLSATQKNEGIVCNYLVGKDKILFTDGHAVGVRKDLNGVLLLDTALQTPVSKTEDIVKVELPLPEANHLFKCLISAELHGVDYVEDVIRELEKEVEKVQIATKGNHKVAKWATVTLKLSHFVLKTVCSNLVLELKRLHQHVPGLPVASAVNDRLSYLLPSGQAETAGGPVERSLMYSEAARRETFSKWPHMNYKWALPDPMAQAGFYHQPSTSGDDRAMCFTCNVCLVCWEPTDEPWSEHERHSPTCPFVKGEYTQNVPFAVTYATEPAVLHGSSGEKIECVSSSRSDEYFATSTLHGNVVVWSMSRQLKKHIQFHVDPWEQVIAAKTGSHIAPELCQLTKPPSPKQAWSETVNKDTNQEGAGMAEPESVHIPNDVEANTEKLKIVEPMQNGLDIVENHIDSNSDTSGTAEVIEVSGAWKTSITIPGEVVEIPLSDLEPLSRGQNRCRPSQDVIVSSLCMLTSQNPSEESAPLGATSAGQFDNFGNKHCLITGVAIRRNTALNDNMQLSPANSGVDLDSGNDVQAMNQVNQALNEDTTPQIISADSSPSPSFTTCSSANSVIGEKTNPFVPYLLVHDICAPRSPQEWKGKPLNEKGIHSGSHGPKMQPVSMSPPVQEMFMPEIMEVDEDPDVQIIGMTPPLTDVTVAKFNHVPPNYTVGSTMSALQSKESKPSSSKSQIDNEGNLTGLNHRKGGRTVQCIELPQQVDINQYVSSIVPTTDGKYVVVVTSPKFLNKEVYSACNNGQTVDSDEAAQKHDCTANGNEEGCSNNGKAKSAGTCNGNTDDAKGGCILVYRVDPSSDCNTILLHENPVKLHSIKDTCDAITSIIVLPPEIAQISDDEEVNVHTPDHIEHTTNEQDPSLSGQIAVTTHAGNLKIFDLKDFHTLLQIKPNEGDKFVSASYCTGMDRLCCCTLEGKLQFYLIGPQSGDIVDREIEQSSPTSKTNNIKDDSVDGSMDQTGKLDDLLVKQSLSSDVLRALHDLTEFENLMPRFSATVPQCWNEIQQEQQHRRHPQHVQQQGEAMHHTRTWRMQPDMTSWDEHLLEIVLPKTCCVGHVDLKFNFHPLCTTPPNIQVTLLKQNISNIGRQGNSQGRSWQWKDTQSIDVDAKIDFKVQVQDAGGGKEKKSPKSPKKSSSKASSSDKKKPVINPVTNSSFLEKHSAEILCGPLDLTGFVDLSGHGGTVTLTSPQLLKVKSRSFLIHLKALDTPNDHKSKAEKTKASVNVGTSTKSDKQKENKGVKSLIDQLTYLPSASVPKQKLDNIKGCDWFQEISITIRKSKKTSVPKDRIQRCAMLELPSFHEQLLIVACGHDEKVGPTNNCEHKQKLALENLTWITALQMNDPTKKVDSSCVVFTVQSNLKALVKACFIEGGRTIAHQCAKLVSLCIEYTKNLEDPDLAPSFNYCLLEALLESLHIVPYAYSAGALNWYFTLLNRVKCMDINMTGQQVADILTTVAKEYHDRANPLHSLLKARFGLYGNPLDPDLFDIDGPQMVKSGSSTPGNYAAVVACNNNTPVYSGSSYSNQAGPGIGHDEVDFKDLISLNAGEKSSSKNSNSENVSSQVFGLLEVEPLHFSCHSTSDATKMERADQGVPVGVGVQSQSGLSGTINFVEGLSSAQATGAALASLSSAMTSAEQQLSMLQQKQQQLLKLQQQKQKLEQKLQETSKTFAGPSPFQSGIGGSSHYNYELFPPTPKTTPLFMTPPVTPPNESFMYMMSSQDGDPLSSKPPAKVASLTLNQSGGAFMPVAATKVSSGKAEGQPKQAINFPHAQQLLQPPPPQNIVIERMHSGARRFVVIDFGKPILLTDVIIPACGDLASLSIDVWVQGEEIDGTRLVVSTDIGIRSLIMNDLMPPPICRYLKLTTIGRYGGSTTRTKIPIGSFYGHTYILPWENNSVTAQGTTGSTPSSNDISCSGPNLSLDQSQILTQLGMFITLQEDIQCRYSLACNRLVSLLSVIDMPQNNHLHTQYYLKKGKKSEEDTKVQQAYHDCMQLQLQLNLAQRAVDRLQKSLGVKVVNIPTNQNSPLLLKQASTDKLRVLGELLLDTLLSTTNSTPSIPQLPVSIYHAFSPQMCEELFRNLCIIGTRKMQIHAGVLLVRLCGNQNWWGDFVGNMLQQFFVVEQPEVFPQDRVFILLTALGQKALSGVCARDMLESTLTLLAKMLSPLLTQQPGQVHVTPTMLDMTLIGWVLLFLSRLLDNVGLSMAEAGDKGSGKEKDKDNTPGSRWDFIQGETAMHNSKQNAKAQTNKLYRRKLQKRLMYRKQQLLDLQQAKHKFLTSQVEKHSSVVSKEAEAVMKEQAQMFKKHLKQYSSKHFKDIMQIRRTDGEYIKKLAKENGKSSDTGDGTDGDLDSTLVVAREKCVPVVKGLMALLLSMDFTCNVDLFIITCKVVAKISNVTRPSIILSEVMSQVELEKLILLCCNLEYNHGNITWGGAWAGHAITCLLQDILDGEKLYPMTMNPEGITDDEISASMTEQDDSISGTSVDEETPSTENATGGAEAAAVTPKEPTAGASGDLDKESSLIMDMVLEDEDFDEETNAKLQEYMTSQPVIVKPDKENFSMQSTWDLGGGSKYVSEASSTNPGSGFINWGAPSLVFSADDKKQKYESWKNKIATIVANKTTVIPQGVSTAMDSRLEYGIELAAELRLKVMLSVETETVQSAIAAPLPPPMEGINHSSQPRVYTNTSDSSVPDGTSLGSQGPGQKVSSSEMLGTCFNNLFTQLQMQRINLDTLLLTWLTLNDDANQEDSTQTGFDPTRVPSIALNQTSVSCLLAALSWAESIPVRTWVLAFQTLTLLTNLKCAGGASNHSDQWLATAMVADPNMMAVLIKFLSGTSQHGPAVSSVQYMQAGPTAAKAFQEFLVRLQLRCADGNENHLKEVLLKLVYTLTAERGAFHCAIGPLDAQCKLLDHMLAQTYDNVDISNGISVIESIIKLTHQHIVSQERVLCRSTSENSVSARSCFGGLFATMLRSNDNKTLTGDTNRDVLMCALLKLVNSLVQIPVPGRGPQRRSQNGGQHVVQEVVNEQPNSTDSSKISQSLGAAGVQMVSATSLETDDQKSSETDEQKTETAGKPKVKSCTHFADVKHPENEVKEVALTDIILGHQQIMMHLIQTLSCCNSNTMAMILSSSGLQGTMQDNFTGIDPLSVGDGVFQILCTLNRKSTDLKLMLRPLFEYLASGFQSSRTAGISRLSEPLLWFILRVLDCEVAIRKFLEMNGIEVLCNNLVNSNRKVINTSPSLISTIMQYLGNGKGSSISAKKAASDSDCLEGMQNFASLGTITSSSPTAGPADVLIQHSPPHRRARSAAWSYHFYPDEAWVDLTISLPCAILLKEVQIQPHLTALATCPASVSIEVSRDGLTTIPICSPVMTSGLTFIKLQLLKSEVVTSVTIRLHKPRDSTTIGLTNISLMGYTAFGETGSVRTSNIFTPTEDYVSRTSIGWLRLLHHCLTESEDVSPEVAAAAAPIQNLLVTCSALLVSPSAAVYAGNIEAVLLKIGLHSPEMGLALIDNLLRNANILAGVPDAPGVPLHSRLNGFANESTVEILYQLGMTQDDGTKERVKAMTDWLGDSARLVSQRISTAQESPRPVPGGSSNSDLPTPAPAHVHCVSAILWQSVEQNVAYNLKEIIDKNLLKNIYDWSTLLATDSPLKKAVDSVLCAMCYIQPEYFTDIVEWLGVSVNMDMCTAITDDHKDSHYQQQPLTDDSKEASGALNGGRGENEVEQQQHMPHDFSRLILDEAHLSSLGIACRSPMALKYLLNSNFPAVLCQGLYEFCQREMMKYSDTVIHPEAMTDSGKSASAGASVEKSAKRRTASESASPDAFLTITADLVAPVLKFLAEISKELVMKDWLGRAEGNLFWSVLLNLLCNTPSQQPTSVNLSVGDKFKVMSSQQRSAIETATVEFFTQVISCHTENQTLFANVLREVISQGPGTQSLTYSGAALSGFIRRLFLQVLLEDEKILVCFRSSSHLYKGHSNALSTVIQHPRCGAGHKYRAVYVSLQSTCGEIINKVSDTPSFTAQLLEDRQEKREKPTTTEEGTKKDTIELGLEVVDQISAAAGLSAKEKRDKSKTSSPPRPPSRRSHRHTPDATLGSSMHIPVVSLYHRVLPGQPLPVDMTLSQFLTLLQRQGYGSIQGQSYIDFTMKLRAKKLVSKPEKRFKLDKDNSLTGEWESPVDHDVEILKEDYILDTPSFPSALQVFASVGGLALIAEHLPLLYPEITRQATPQETSRDVSSGAGVGHEWVTVESNDDIYEELFEPMPPSQPSQPSKQSAPALPTIPPHSLVAFGLFLRLPGYAEVLLKERKKAQCLLRLVLGVTDDGEGGHILTSPVAGALPTLPFNVLKTLFDTTPLTTDDGVLLRRRTLEIGAVHLVLACLSVLSHHAPRTPIPGFHQDIILAATAAASALSTVSTTTGTTKTNEDKSQNYWAKGTGFGTGSTTSSWDAEQALLRQKSEEEHVTCLLQVLASYINPGSSLPKNFESDTYEKEELSEKSGLPEILPELLNQSCLVPAMSSYLRNDSVLDMARHVPLYRALLELLRAVAVCPIIVPLLLPLEKDDDTATSVSSLLEKMKSCVDTYASRLRNNKGKASKTKQDDSESEGLAMLIPDIQETARIVHVATHRVREKSTDSDMDEVDLMPRGAARDNHSEEERYKALMKELQFDTYELVVEADGHIKFAVAHHYESHVKATGEVNNAARARRLAQETVTLSTSLPLSYSSSVFVRCDEERLDVMKVLITGPCDTPYANGCFEFDVYFPQDYPNSPPFINLETTGNHTVRFNPNLYNDGKVCLSVLNTWHGRPEEKWNPQTSSFLQVLVSIQSLILVSEPYFNEPGYERSRGTPSGTASSREYDANIRQATVKWAMLEQLRNASACFKEVVQKHFYLKKNEIICQIDEWIKDMEANSGDKRTGRTIAHSCVVLKRHFTQLKEEFVKMKTPADLVEEEEAASGQATSPGQETHQGFEDSPSLESSRSGSEVKDVGNGHVNDVSATESDIENQNMLSNPNNNVGYTTTYEGTGTGEVTLNYHPVNAVLESSGNSTDSSQSDDTSQSSTPDAYQGTVNC